MRRTEISARFWWLRPAENGCGPVAPKGSERCCKTYLTKGRVPYPDRAVPRACSEACPPLSTASPRLVPIGRPAAGSEALRSGTGPKLQYALDSGTILDDMAQDVLTGGLGRVWFWVTPTGSTKDIITDLDRGQGGQFI